MSAQSSSAAGSPAAHSTANDLTAALSQEIKILEKLDLHELRVRWRKLFRKPAPPHLPKYLLFRIIAYRIQANALGDLDPETVRLLDRLAREHAAGRDAKALVPSASDKPAIKPGTLLVREHDGVLHRVMALQEGFAWNGGTYASLSEVARAITGTNWNGPRFFGLRERKRQETVQATEGRAP